MSALGHKQTYAVQKATAAKGQKRTRPRSEASLVGSAHQHPPNFSPFAHSGNNAASMEPRLDGCVSIKLMTIERGEHAARAPGVKLRMVNQRAPPIASGAPRILVIE